MSVKIPYHFQHLPMGRRTNRCLPDRNNNKPDPIELTREPLLAVKTILRFLASNLSKPLTQLTHIPSNIPHHNLLHRFIIAWSSRYSEERRASRFHQPTKNPPINVIDSPLNKQCRQTIAIILEFFGVINDNIVKQVKRNLPNSQADKVTNDTPQHPLNIETLQHAQIVAYYFLHAIKESYRIIHTDAYPTRTPSISPTQAVSIVCWKQCKPNSKKEILTTYHELLNLYKKIIQQKIHCDDSLHTETSGKEKNSIHTGKKV